MFFTQLILGVQICVTCIEVLLIYLFELYCISWCVWQWICHLCAYVEVSVFHREKLLFEKCWLGSSEYSTFGLVKAAVHSSWRGDKIYLEFWILVRIWTFWIYFDEIQALNYFWMMFYVFLRAPKSLELLIFDDFW